MKRSAVLESVCTRVWERTAHLRRCLSVRGTSASAAEARATSFGSLSVPHRTASTAEAAQQEREAAWKSFVTASRQLRNSLHKGASAPQPCARPSTCAESAEPPSPSSATDIDGDADEALAAMAPDIVRQTPTTASNATLMRELGVLDRAECQTAVKRANVGGSPGASTDDSSAAVHYAASLVTSPWLLSVCRTGVHAQVSSCIILRHLWGAFEAARMPPEDLVSKAAEEPLRTPTMEWSASLPASVRLLLLSHELERVHRRRRYATGGLQGNFCIATEESLHDEGQTPAHALSKMWVQTVHESRAVVLSCCAPWLLHHSVPANTSTESCDTAPLLSRVFLSPLERYVLDAGMKLCAACQAEDVARALMAIFMRGVDSCISDLCGQSGNTAAFTEKGAFREWYTTEAATLYESAMAAAAAPRTHASLTTSCVYGTAIDGFPLAYSYLTHRGATLARLSAATGEEGHDREVSVATQLSPSSSISGNSWSTSLIQQPRCAMRLVRALALSVDANADHFNVILQLYLRLVEETEVGYNTDSAGETRLAFCAILNALARVPLESKTCMGVLEDVYRRTLLHTESGVPRHPDVLASCLRVCGAAGVPNRAVTLFNKLCEPSSRAIAVEERNVVAVLLSTPAAAALQRLLSFMHTKVPVTADAVHAAAARALMASTKPLCSDSSTVFAFFDLLEIQLAAEHNATHRTAALYADRTFFLRVLTLLAGVHERRYGDNTGCEALGTTAAAAVFRQWIASAAQHQPRNSSWASTLSPVTVGVLQELDLELRRAARVDSPIGVSSSSTAPVSSLVAAIEEVLEAASGSLPPSIRPISSVEEGALKSNCTLYTLPESLQWRQLQAEWQYEEQKRFLEGASRLLLAPDAGGSAAMACVRYQDWAVLHELQSKRARVTSQEHLADAWARAVLARRKHSKAAVSTLPSTSEGGATDRTSLCVLTPVAEVKWWLLQDSDCSHDIPLMLTVSLADRLGAMVPPAVGCPAHTWSTDPAAVHGSAQDRRTKVVSYWLQRWVDSVEDARVLPRHTLFRTTVRRLLQQLASAVLAVEDSGEAMEHAEGRDRPSESPSPSKTPAGPPPPSRIGRSSGVEAVLVRGPSLVYQT
ncbi:hypothetical protein LSCM1_08225 [Leishmania martiniquensis]|uniref:Uncharacterized protein n=1 Tax=Leishmania martiniquensis TaxID=1580590 RepID=A0A836KYS4_9TRYP|nr:hypothetical protein LSCM1_08225 [Leishmania martiniquensis]